MNLLYSANPELAKVLGQLDSMVGQEKAKAQLRDIAAIGTIDAKRVAALVAAGLGTLPTARLKLFAVVGEPGTGQTSIARHLAAVLKATGQISHGHVVEVTRADLVGGSVGQSTQRTTEAVRSALGGVLVIDDADMFECESDSNGLETICTLVSLIEQHRDDLAVIISGQQDPVMRLLDRHPGLKARVSDIIHLTPFSDDELVKLFCQAAAEQGYSLVGDDIAAARDALAGIRSVRQVQHLFETARTKAASRLFNQPNRSKADLSAITAQDVRAAAGLSLAA